MIMYWSYYSDVQNRPTALTIRITTCKASIITGFIRSLLNVCVYVMGGG